MTQLSPSLTDLSILIPDEVFIEDNRGDNTSCGCDLPCEEIIYKKEISYMDYPSIKAGEILQQLENRDVDYMR